MSQAEATIVNPSLFIYHPYLDRKKVQRKVICPDFGPHLYLRKVKIPVQARLLQLLAHDNAPQVTLFGSPHIDNYTQTNTGIGLIDFDRAITGPYFSDFVYCLLSIALKNKDGHQHPLSSTVCERFQSTYVDFLQSPEKPLPPFQALQTQTLEPWEQDISTFVASDRGWLKRARKNPLPDNDALVNALVSQYFVNRQEADLYSDYQIITSGLSTGSLGRVHTIVLLQHKQQADYKLLDIKPAKDYRERFWPHGRYYHHNFQHEGQRMIAASQLLAPGITGDESYASANGCQYWARSIQACNRKFKTLLSEDQQLDFATAAAAQIARGHHQSLETEAMHASLLTHVQTSYSEIVEAVEIIQRELLAGWQQYCRNSTANKKT